MFQESVFRELQSQPSLDRGLVPKKLVARRPVASIVNEKMVRSFRKWVLNMASTDDEFSQAVGRAEVLFGFECTRCDSSWRSKGPASCVRAKYLCCCLDSIHPNLRCSFRVYLDGKHSSVQVHVGPHEDRRQNWGAAAEQHSVDHFVSCQWRRQLRQCRRERNGWFASANRNRTVQCLPCARLSLTISHMSSFASCFHFQM